MLMCGCSTKDASRLMDLSIRRSPRPPTLLPGYDVYMVREDLVKATHSETQTTYVDGQASTQTVQVPNAYSELVIDFGNGIVSGMLKLKRYVEVIREGDSILVKRSGRLKAEYRINTD